jgi:hypothetical protein
VARPVRDGIRRVHLSGTASQLNAHHTMAKKQLRIGLIGYSFMGRAHSNAFHQVNHFFPSSYELVPQAVCGRDAAKVQEFADKWAYKSIETDWRVERDDIDVITSRPTNAESHRRRRQVGRK